MPWGLGKVVQVVVLWIFGFAFVALVGVPFVQVLTGLDAPSTSAWQVTSFTFCIDIMEFLVAFGVVRATLREFDLTRLNLWKVKVRGLWPLAVALLCLTFPLVNLAAEVNRGAFHTSGWIWAPPNFASKSFGEVSANVALICWTTLMSPVWEEFLFRGFLLRSLRKQLPTSAAIVVSSFVFALLHFSPATMLPLLLLGVIFGVLFVKTNNLLACMLLHTLWNVYAFWVAATNTYALPL